MDGRGKSDGSVVPAKSPNNAGVPVAEAVEGRGPAEGNAASKTRAGRRAGHDASSALGRVRRRALEDEGARFSALLHHVDADRLGAVEVRRVTLVVRSPVQHGYVLDAAADGCAGRESVKQRPLAAAERHGSCRRADWAGCKAVRVSF